MMTGVSGLGELRDRMSLASTESWRLSVLRARFMLLGLLLLYWLGPLPLRYTVGCWVLLLKRCIWRLLLFSCAVKGVVLLLLLRALRALLMWSSSCI